VDREISAEEIRGYGWEDWCLDKMKKEKEFYLNWSQDVLLGRELEKSHLVVLAMMEGIRLGHEFPAVEIFKLEDNVYRIADGYKGGHHRAIAHRLSFYPLRSKIVPMEDIVPLESVSIGMIHLGKKYSEQQLYDSLRFLPKEVVKRFCNENNLEVDRYLLQQFL